MSSRPPSPSDRWPARSWLLGVVLAFYLAGSLPAQSSREYDLKAVFLYNFASFVEWPEAARPKPGEPMIIGVLGQDPFGAVLDEVVAGEKRPLAVRRYRTPEAAREAHILYISASEAWRMPMIFQVLQGKAVLTVSDMPPSVDNESIISFSTGARLQLHINLAAAEQVGLSISSKLLRVATVTGGGASP